MLTTDGVWFRLEGVKAGGSVDTGLAGGQRAAQAARGSDGGIAVAMLKQLQVRSCWQM